MSSLLSLFVFGVTPHEFYQLEMASPEVFPVPHSSENCTCHLSIMRP